MLNLEPIVVYSCFYLYSIFACFVTFDKNNNVLKTKSSKFVLAISVLSFVYQVMYGLIDLATGILSENWGYEAANNLRVLISMPLLSSTAFITDLIATFISYYFFYLICFGKFFSTPKALHSSQWQIISIKYSLISVGIGLLLKIANIGCWYGGNSIVDLFCVALFFFIFTQNMSTSMYKFVGGRTPKAIIASGIIFPLVEPLLGNAFQFIGFAVLIIAALRFKKSKTVGVSWNDLIKENFSTHQKIAFFSILSIAIPVLLLLNIHMTAFSPIDNYYQMPVTATIFYQLTVLFLLISIQLNNIAGKISLVLGLVTFHLIFFILYSYTDIYILKDNIDILNKFLSFFKNISAFKIMLFLYLTGLFIPLSLLGFQDIEQFFKNDKPQLYKYFRHNLVVLFILVSLATIWVVILFHTISTKTLDKLDEGASIEFFKDSLQENLKHSNSVDLKLKLINHIEEQSASIKKIKKDVTKKLIFVSLVISIVMMLLATTNKEFRLWKVFIKSVRSKLGPKIACQVVNMIRNDQKRVFRYFFMFNYLPYVYFILIFPILFLTMYHGYSEFFNSYDELFLIYENALVTLKNAIQ